MNIISCGVDTAAGRQFIKSSVSSEVMFCHVKVYTVGYLQSGVCVCVRNLKILYSLSCVYPPQSG